MYITGDFVKSIASQLSDVHDSDIQPLVYFSITINAYKYARHHIDTLGSRPP